jgi:hypothetical protein
MQSPPIVFSPSLRYAFVQRTPLTLTRNLALRALDRHLTFPQDRGFLTFDSSRARTIGLERWDLTGAGETAVWRVFVSDACDPLPTWDRRHTGWGIVAACEDEFERESLPEVERQRALILLNVARSELLFHDLVQEKRGPDAPLAPLSLHLSNVLTRLALLMTRSVSLRLDAPVLTHAIRALNVLVRRNDDAEISAFVANLPSTV